MPLFWILTAALAVAMVALLALALLRNRGAETPAAAFDLQIYRDQLREVDRDAARGVIGADEAERLRAEVSRRILAADAKLQSGGAAEEAPPAASWAVVALIAAVVLAGSFQLYTRLGAPGYDDMALADRIAAAETLRADRPSQQQAEAQMPATAEPDMPAEYAELVDRLRATVAERPDDPQGLKLLIRSEAALGNYSAAHAAQARLIDALGDAATAKDHADHADMLILAAGGYVSPEAEDALQEALARDPGNGVARYYAGLMMAQTGRPDRAFRLWDQLLRESEASDPWVAPLGAQIGEIAARAGIRDYSPPAIVAQPGAAPGPDAGDIEAAGEMTAEERQQMVRGMVARLSDRLATEGGTPQEWARLISAHGVLGDEAQAIAIWNDAQQVFADTPEALAIVRDGARQAGIVP